jgi:membrane-associated phospholipid phosphatase
MLDRLSTHWRFKLAAGLSMNLVVLGGYHLAQRRGGEAFAIPAILGEDALPFLPEWTPLYLSSFLFSGLGFWLCAERELLRRQLWAIGLCGLSAVACFFLWPSACPRPTSEANGLYACLLQLDSPLNACPSLHAALPLLSLLALHRQKFPPLCQTGFLLWALAIWASTLFLHQHRLIDLAAGFALAAICWIFSARFSPPQPRTTP